MLTNLKKIIPRAVKARIKKWIVPSSRKCHLKEFEGALLNLHAGSFIDDKVINKNNFEPYLRTLFKYMIQPGWTVIDVGANVGIHSAYLSQLVGPEGVVFAFEPIKYIFDRLQTNMTLSGALNVVPLNYAVTELSSEIEILEVQENGYELGSSSLLKNEHLAGMDTNLLKKKKVKGISLDDFCDKIKIKPRLIKMDIEGYEIFALKGAKKLIGEISPIFIIEYNSKRIDFLEIDASFFQEIFANNYSCYEIRREDDVERFVSLEPFNFDRSIRADVLCLPKIVDSKYRNL